MVYRARMNGTVHRVLAAAFATFAIVFWSLDALAGSWKLKSAEVNEVAGAWHLYVNIELNQAPPMAHVPMKFIFTKLVVYERALVDNSKDPVINKVPLTGQIPATESLDVDFGDGTGKTFKGTRYDFSISRDHGFESGEYKVVLRTSDGIDVGSAQTLILKGDNPVVDRRSITFNAKDPNTKKIAAVDAGAKVAENNVESAVQSNEVAPVGSAPKFIPDSAYEKTPEEELKEHPKGCGCDVPGLSTSAWSWLAAPALALVFFARRRKQ